MPISRVADTRSAGAGYAAVALAAVLWAFGGALASELIDRGASALELTEARAWISAAGLAAYGALRRPERRGRPSMGIVVLFGMAIAATNFFYYLSLSLLPVAVAITVQYTAPALVVVWVSCASRSAPSHKVVGSLALAVVGVALLAELPGMIVHGGASLSLAGFGAAFAAAVAFATSIVSGERLGRRLGAADALVRGFVVASVFWAGVQLSRGRPDTLLDPAFVPWVVVLAVFTTIVPFVLFLWGLERVDASRAGIVATLEPLAAALLAFVWLGQTLGVVQIVGGLMVVLGVGVVQAERPLPPDVLAQRAAVE